MTKRSRTVLCRDVFNRRFRIDIRRLSFRPSVYGVIVRNGKVLLSKQWDGYDFPGGGIEIGESINEALVREVKEETGLRVAVGSIVTVQNSFFKYRNENKYVQSILMYYTCRVIGGTLSTKYFDKDEKNYASMAEWINVRNVGRLKFYNPVDSPGIIRQAETKRR